MKKTLLLLTVLLTISFGQAQNLIDGLRYGTDLTTGTARFNAMSGAFGALGGDLSAIAINPAGSAVFLQNSAAFTLSLDGMENSSNYFGNSTNNEDTELNINQAGGVFLFDNFNEDSPWKKFSLALNFNQTQSHDNELFIQGVGNTSIANFFLEQAQGLRLDLLELQGQGISGRYANLGATNGSRAQNAFLGFQAFIFDPLTNDPGNTQYTSNVAGNRFDHQYIYLSQGFNGKYSFNMGAQYTDNFFFGINLNSHVIDYEQSTLLFEDNQNTGSVVNQIDFENNLSVLGAGFSAQIGMIAKLASDFRVGFTYDTPTWFVISEETTQYLETVRTVDNQSITEIIDPRVINVFADYNLRTPGKITGSAAYIFGKDGLISLDYSYKDFSNMKFSPTNDGAFTVANAEIKNTLKAVSSFKVGGEYRFNNLSLRGGFNYEESPYSDDTILGDRQGFSAGLGYNFGNYSFDLAYSRSEQSRNQELYSVGLTDTASIDTIYNNFLFTLGLSL